MSDQQNSSVEFELKTQSSVIEIDGIRYYVEPVSTILLLLKAAAAILSIVRFFAKSDFDKDVLAPLKTIIDGIDNIIKELQSIRDYLPVALDDAFRKRLTSDVATAVDSFSIILSGLSDDEIRKLSHSSTKYHKIEANAAKQLENALNLRAYDFPGYFAVSTAALSYISMCAVLHTPKAEVVNFCSKINDWLISCVDPKNVRSAAFAMNKMKADADAARQVVESHPRNVFLGSYIIRGLFSAEADNLPAREPPDRNDRPERPPSIHVNWYATLQGSFDTGLSWSPERVPSEGENPRGWPLMPGEDNVDLYDRDESAQARCRNSLNGIPARTPGLNSYVSRGRNLYDRVKEIDGTIRGIRDLVQKIKLASEKF